MIEFERARFSSQHADRAGGEYIVVGERMVLSLGGRLGGAGVSYTHPIGVIRDGRWSPVRDLVLLARLAALLAVTLAAIAGTLRR